MQGSIQFIRQLVAGFRLCISRGSKINVQAGVLEACKNIVLSVHTLIIVSIERFNNGLRCCWIKANISQDFALLNGWVSVYTFFNAVVRTKFTETQRRFGETDRRDRDGTSHDTRLEIRSRYRVMSGR